MLVSSSSVVSISFVGVLQNWENWRWYQWVNKIDRLPSSCDIFNVRIEWLLVSKETAAALFSPLQRIQFEITDAHRDQRLISRQSDDGSSSSQSSSLGHKYNDFVTDRQTNIYIRQSKLCKFVTMLWSFTSQYVVYIYTGLKITIFPHLNQYVPAQIR